MTKTLVSHVGIAVKDLDAAIKSYSVLTGQKNPLLENVESENVKVALFSSGGSRIELLAATSDDSPIARFINKRGEGLHHICMNLGMARAAKIPIITTTIINSITF